MRRFLEALGRWLPLLACCSGSIVTAAPLSSSGIRGYTMIPDLDEQQAEILRFVELEELKWNRKRVRQRRVPGPGSR